MPPDIWVVANFKESQLKNMRTNQPVLVEIDALGGKKFRGQVDSIQAGSGAAFSLLPPENATGNFVKVVQRVPVKILFDRAAARRPHHRAGLVRHAKRAGEPFGEPFCSRMGDCLGGAGFCLGGEIGFSIPRAAEGELKFFNIGDTAGCKPVLRNRNPGRLAAVSSYAPGCLRLTVSGYGRNGRGNLSTADR